jgi:hypothetical protein
MRDDQVDSVSIFSGWQKNDDGEDGELDKPESDGKHAHRSLLKAAGDSRALRWENGVRQHRTARQVIFRS